MHRDGVMADSPTASRRSVRYDLAPAVFRAGAVRVPSPGSPARPDRLPSRPSVLCFNHLSWIDPVLLMALLPKGPGCTCTGRMRRASASAAGIR